mgnify:CR=1 FL=1
MSIKIRVLGSWWDTPEGDFPVRAIAVRIRELRDSEVIKLGEEKFVVAIKLYEDSISYGVGVFVVTKDSAFLVLLKEAEDWEAVKKYVKEKYGILETPQLYELLLSIAKKEAGIVELS